MEFAVEVEGWVPVELEGREQVASGRGKTRPKNKSWARRKRKTMDVGAAMDGGRRSELGKKRWKEEYGLKIAVGNERERRVWVEAATMEEIAGVRSLNLIYFLQEVERSKHEWLMPTKGNAVLLFNVHPNASPDRSGSHECRPVDDGELWCAVKLLYMRAVVPEGLSAGSDDAECNDLDDDSPQ